MKLTKKERAALREKCGGRCAYCGKELGQKWHADHVMPVVRKLEFVREEGRPTRLRTTGEAWFPEHDHIGNMMPACVPCNIDKHASSLEGWRQALQRTHEVLRANASRYRHGLRFGLIEERPGPVVFYFETLADTDERSAAPTPPVGDRKPNVPDPAPSLEGVRP